MSTQILSESPKAFFRDRFGQALNLAVGDMVKSVRSLRDTMDATYEISNLVKISLERDAMLEKIRDDLTLAYSGFLAFCPTR